MANAQVRNRLGTADKRQGRHSDTTQITNTLANNTKDVASMRARLTAISATSYTAERLDAMTANDMLYAIRLADDAAGI